MPKRRVIDHHGLDMLIRQRQSILHVRELAQIGVPSSTISYRTRPSGPWQRTLPGVVAATSGQLTWTQRALAAICYAGGGALVTGAAALRLYGIGRFDSEGHQIDVLLPHRRQRSSAGYVHVHRTRRLPTHRTIRGVPCVPVARAVIDAGLFLHDLDAVRALTAAAVQQQRCTVRDLAGELATATPNGSKLPRLVLREVTDGTRSVAEARVRKELHRAGLPDPLWNHDVYDAWGNWLGRPDAVWPELAVVMEIDSMAWHLSPASYRRTQARQRRMTKAGVLVIPVAPGDADRDEQSFAEEVAATLKAAGRRRAPHITVVSPRS